MKCNCIYWIADSYKIGGKNILSSIHHGALFGDVFRVYFLENELVTLSIIIIMVTFSVYA